LKQESAPELSASSAVLRQYIDQSAAHADASLMYWRAAGRMVLVLLLGYSGFQYYVFDVYLTIMGLPRLTIVGVALGNG
jgi:hypothetical protein